jgi:hypothetical protein
MKTPNKSTTKPATKKATASGNAGLSGAEMPQTTVIREVASGTTGLVVWGVKLLVIGLGCYWVYGKITNRFVGLKTNKNYPLANISDAQAQTRATAIASSLALFDFTGNEFDVTSANLAGLNYNGFIKVYNAFGKQGGHAFAGQLNLIEWIHDQFDATEVSQLSSLLGGAFFRTANGLNYNEMTDLKQLIATKP